MSTTILEKECHYCSSLASTTIRNPLFGEDLPVCTACAAEDAAEEKERKEEIYREVFSDEFYRLWDIEGFGETDAQAGSDYPWGCPWEFSCDYEKTSDPEKDAQIFFDGYKGEIADFQKQVKELGEGE